MLTLDDGRKIKFREDFVSSRVQVIVDGVVKFAENEYRTAAERSQAQFGLSDSQLMALYEDYKEDYDS